MSLDIEKIKKEAEKELKNIPEIRDVDAIWRKYLGRKGCITLELRQIKDLPHGQRGQKGDELNRLKDELEEIFKFRLAQLEKKSYEEKAQKEWLDVSRP
ncbi:MAG: hypothetical protein WD712_01605, partial [Candidatus Spechtbacterales bacterium]